MLVNIRVDTHHDGHEIIDLLDDFFNLPNGIKTTTCLSGKDGKCYIAIGSLNKVCLAIKGNATAWEDIMWNGGRIGDLPRSDNSPMED